jgi:replicative DNA helicase
MSSIELADRLLCSRARVNGYRVAPRHDSTQDDRMKLAEKAADQSAEAPLYVDDSPGRTVSQIAAGARRIKRRSGGLGLIVIDYSAAHRARQSRRIRAKNKSPRSPAG